MVKKKILIVGIYYKQLIDTFKENNHVFFVRRNDYIGNLNRIINKSIKNFKPDIIFLQLQDYGEELTCETLNLLKKYFTINFTHDKRDVLDTWYYKAAPFFNYTIFTNEDDVQLFKKLKLSSIYLPVFYDSSDNDGSIIENPNDNINFMANYYYPLSSLPSVQERIDMVRFLKENYKERFKLYGDNWRQLDIEAEKKNCECESDRNYSNVINLYKKSKFGIHITQFDKNNSRCFSNRLLLIMDSSTLCLVKRYKNIEVDFKDKVHLRIWDTFDDLKNLIDYYTDPKNEEERKEIAMNGAKYVQQNFTCKNFVNNLFANVSESYSVYEQRKKQKHTNKVFRFFGLD